ncbi:MAG: ABC transporter ATP-binding protein [Oscillospiraceae bacterium]|nr:ABC transporter ATP-binding protein [Oscillospiraceae bacterium]
MPDILTLQNYSLELKRDGSKYSIIGSADMHIGEGEIVGLIGESGSGKSMLWKSVLGLADPKRWEITGNVILNGSSIRSLDKNQMTGLRGRDAAVIMQDPMNAFDQVFTIERHFTETAKIHKGWTKEETRAKATELLRRMNIREPGKVLKMYPFQCSGGMLQRIMIALAVMLDTPLIIADEPTTSVDVTVQREIVSLLREINREHGTSILYISHDLKIVENIADRIYVMYAGYLVESFPAAMLREGRVNHPYTVKLLQSRPSYTRDYLPAMEGSPPTLAERQAGCPFAPRCEYAQEKCGAFDMAETAVDDAAPEGAGGHTVRCCRMAELTGENI